MARKRIPKRIEKNIQEYINILQKDKLPIEKVFLFGSYAKGKQHEWSDIDLCVFSSRFKDPWVAMQYLWSKKTPGSIIEPIGFHPKEMEDHYDSLIHEIKTTGVEISISHGKKKLL